jgi:hypothetical protein
MKQLTAVFLALLIALICVGCGKEPEETRKNNNRRTTEADQNGNIWPGGDDSTKQADPSGSEDSKTGFPIAVTWANWKSFIEFYKVEDRSTVTPFEKTVDYTFAVRAKEGYELKSLTIQLNATLYYRCGNADMGEYVEKEIVLTMDSPTHTIRFTRDDLINYNGRIVESVYYDDIIAITAKVVKK